MDPALVSVLNGVAKDRKTVKCSEAVSSTPAAAKAKKIAKSSEASSTPEVAKVKKTEGTPRHHCGQRARAVKRYSSMARSLQTVSWKCWTRNGEVQ